MTPWSMGGADLIRARLHLSREAGSWLLLTVLVLLAYFAVTGWLAARDLQGARSGLHELKAAVLADDLPQARDSLITAQRSARAGHRWMAGPLWAAAAHVP